jgi:membrane-associated phospholipid phosphatase
LRCFSPRRGFFLLVGALLATLLARTALAEPAPYDPRTPVELRLNLPLDLGITLGGAALFATTEVLTPVLAQKSCGWCDRNADGSDNLNGFDSSVRRALRWRSKGTAGTLSDVFSFVLAPSVGAGIGALVAWHDDRLRELPEDILLVAEAAVIAMNTTQLAKFTVGRERPYAHFRTAAARASEQSDADNLSFYSGHSTLAFSLATAAGTVASMRRHSLAPVMWIAGLTFASTGAYLRVAADKHYATDVLVGSLVGASIGFAVPYFAHGPRALRVSALPVDHGHGLALGGEW